MPSGDAHVYTVASGFGLRVIPKAAPYRFRLAPVPTELDVDRLDGRAWLFARVIPDDDGYQSRLAEGTRSLADVADVVSGPGWNGWWLETSVYRVPLPAGWTALCGQGPYLFDLIGPDESLIFMQTPSRVMPVSDIHRPGQVVASTGKDARSEWVDLTYVHDGAEWRQRHHVLRLIGVNVVITAQARADAMAAATETQRELVTALAVGAP